MKNNDRFPEIDFLRGLSILAMVLIHSTVYYLSSRIAFFIWDASQFAVVAFILCSGFLYFQKTQNNVIPGLTRNPIKIKLEMLNQVQHDKSKGILHFILKRLLRLLIPYYIFVPFFSLVIFIVHPKQLTTYYILQSTFLIGGIDINWLVVLFLQFTFLMPFLSWVYQKSKAFFIFYSMLAVGSSIFFVFTHTSINWKWIMWLPWSVVIIFAILFIKLKLSEKPKAVFSMGLVFSVLYLIFRFVESQIGHSLTQFSNKYPPTIYNISYGLAVVCFIYLLIRHCEELATKQSLLTGLPRSLWSLAMTVKKLLTFLSRNSYSFYFIHYCVLILFADFFTRRHIHWSIFFFSVFFTSIVVQQSINYIRERILRLRSG